MLFGAAFSPFRSPLWAVLFGCGLAAPSLPNLGAQTQTIGYQPLTDAGHLSSGFTEGFGSGKADVIPFDFTGLGSYSVGSISLLLSGDASLSDVSVSISSALPTNLGSETSLASFSLSGTLNSTPTVYTFNAESTPALTAGATYYLQLGYTGSATVNWILTTSAGQSGVGFFSGSGGIPPLTPVNSTLSPSEFVTFRQLTAGGSSDDYQQVGGFSVTAEAMSAVPEPATYGLVMGAAALLAGLIARRRRMSDGPIRSGG
jgi:hypothetical protein